MQLRLGIIGGGQLGRMLAMSARHWGVRTVMWADQVDSPAAQVCDAVVVGPYACKNALNQFVEQIDYATYEFENLPLTTIQAVENTRPVHPNSQALAVAQDRLAEKAMLSKHSLPVVPYRVIQAEEDLKDLAAFLQHASEGGVLKTATLGYDGKGQRRVRTIEDLKAAWHALGKVPCVLEAWTPFVRELSLIGARNAEGDVVFYPLVDNHHENHILALTTAPAPNLADGIQVQAELMMRQLFKALGYVGVLTMELFELADGSLLINELAPRPHNSGHWTIEGALTSQFEQQLRACCGWPLGPTTYQPSVMVNLLGEHWPMNLKTLLAEVPTAKLHDYGKQESRPGRKMGHMTVIEPSELFDWQAVLSTSKLL